MAVGPGRRVGVGRGVDVGQGVIVGTRISLPGCIAIGVPGAQSVSTTVGNGPVWSLVASGVPSGDAAAPGPAAGLQPTTLTASTITVTAIGHRPITRAIIMPHLLSLISEFVRIPE